MVHVLKQNVFLFTYYVFCFKRNPEKKKRTQKTMAYLLAGDIYLVLPMDSPVFSCFLKEIEETDDFRR